MSTSMKCTQMGRRDRRRPYRGPRAPAAVAAAAAGLGNLKHYGCPRVPIHASSRPRPTATSGSPSRSVRPGHVLHPRFGCPGHAARRHHRVCRLRRLCHQRHRARPRRDPLHQRQRRPAAPDHDLGRGPQQHLALRRVFCAARSTASRRTRPASGSPTSSTTGSVASTSSPLRARTRSRTSPPRGWRCRSGPGRTCGSPVQFGSARSTPPSGSSARRR